MHNMRYLASVVSNCFTAFGELLALNKRFAELSGGVTRYPLTSPPPQLIHFSTRPVRARLGYVHGNQLSLEVLNNIRLQG